MPTCGEDTANGVEKSKKQIFTLGSMQQEVQIPITFTFENERDWISLVPKTSGT